MSRPWPTATECDSVDFMPRVMIDDYPHRLGGHCGSGALRDLIDWAGLGWDGPPTEALVFGLSGGLDFHWMRIPDSNPPFYVGGRTVELELDLCRRLGITVERRQTDDASEGWTWITDELHAGRPVMIWADILRLPYLRVRLTNTCHDIVVTGYDTETGVAYVADNDREEIQEVPLEDLAKARDSSGFPVPNRHGTFPMRFPEKLPDLLPLAREAASASAANLGPANEDPLADLLPDGVGYAGGLPGIRQFASDMARWPDDLPPETLTAAHRPPLPGGLHREGRHRWRPLPPPPSGLLPRDSDPHRRQALREGRRRLHGLR